VGISNFVGAVIATSDQVCSVVTTCVKLGPGLFAGVGGSGGLGFFDGRLKSGSDSLSFGGVVEGGDVVADGLSVDVSTKSLTAGKGFGGLGEGAAAGLQVCSTRVASCTSTK